MALLLLRRQSRPWWCYLVKTLSLRVGELGCRYSVVFGRKKIRVHSSHSHNLQGEIPQDSHTSIVKYFPTNPFPIPIKSKGIFKKKSFPWSLARVFREVSRGEFIRKIFSLLFKFSWMQIFFLGGGRGVRFMTLFSFLFPPLPSLFFCSQNVGWRKDQEIPPKLRKLKKNHSYKRRHFITANAISWRLKKLSIYFCTVIATWMRSKLRKKKPLPPSSSKETKVHSKETASASHLPEKRKGQKSLFFLFLFLAPEARNGWDEEEEGEGKRKVQLRRREEEEDEKKRHKSRRRRRRKRLMRNLTNLQVSFFFLVCPKERRNCGKAIILLPLFVSEAFCPVSYSTDRTAHLLQKIQAMNRFWKGQHLISF